MHPVVKKVYDSLKESTEAIAEKTDKCWYLEEKLKSDRYTDKAKSEDIRPQRDALKREIENDSADALKKAASYVREYQEKLERADMLNPSDITDDIRLLNIGVKLKPRDIVSMLNRNKGNATMTQIILRYADENMIDMGADRQIYVGNAQEIKEAENLIELINSYGKWIAHDNAIDILNKYFMVSEPTEDSESINSEPKAE